MPTLLEINVTPAKAQDAQKLARSGEISFVRKDEKENDKNKKSKFQLSTKDKGKNESRKHRRGDKQLSIFESIGIPEPAGKIGAPKNCAVGALGTSASDANADDPTSSKKKRKRKTSSAFTAKDNSFPIIVHVHSENKEPKKVVITCHGVRREFNDAIVGSPIVVEEKLAIPKDPVARFLVGFGRFIH